MNAPGVLPLKNSANAWVPLDDENTMVWSIGRSACGLRPGRRRHRRPQGRRAARRPASGRFDPYGSARPATRSSSRSFAPDTTDWLGRFRPIANKHNDYLIDRELQADIEWTRSGPSGHLHRRPRPRPGPDGAGDAWARSTTARQEHLGTTDAMIIRTRRKLLNAAKALRDQGVTPAASTTPTSTAALRRRHPAQGHQRDRSLLGHPLQRRPTQRRRRHNHPPRCPLARLQTRTVPPGKAPVPLPVNGEGAGGGVRPAPKLFMGCYR